MTLAVARPWKQPRTGIYWLRKRVPQVIRELVAKTEKKRSLGTRDPLEAKLRHSEALLEVERRWTNVRQPVGSLSERQQLAARAYEDFLAEHSDCIALGYRLASCRCLLP